MNENEAKSSKSSAATVPVGGGDDGRRVSILVGDRLCASCGYNLTGQSVIREPIYDMLIVRCPECATVASVQEYPLLGKWAPRWGALAAAGWLLVVIILALAASGVVVGFSFGAADIAADVASNRLRSQFEDEQLTTGRIEAEKAAADPSYTAIPPDLSWASLDAWWAKQSEEKINQITGGRLAVFNGLTLLLWIPMWLIVFSFGVAATVACPHLKRAGLVIPVVLIIGGALAIAAVPLTEWISQPRNQVNFWSGVRVHVSLWAVVITILASAVPLMLGVQMGRAIGRLMVRALLPPRMRNSLAFLWLADGHEPPRTMAR